VDGAGRKWWRRLLQPGQRRPVRPSELGWQGGLKYRECLADLQRAALELSKHAEDLLGGSLLDLLRDNLGRTAADSLAQPDHGTASQSGWQGGELDSPGDGPAWHVAHGYLLSAIWPLSAI
jgi:hypothetical protein